MDFEKGKIDLEKFIDLLPSHIFWKDKNGMYLGCNLAFAKGLGFESPADVIGKTDYDFPVLKGFCDAYRSDDKKIMSSGIPKIDIEEKQVFSNGREAYLTTSKAPIFDSKNKIIGILGIYSDITEKKEAERLRVANQAKKIKLQEQSKFQNIATQVAHDIRSPISSMMMLIKDCDGLAESTRTSLREAAESINGIAENLIASWGHNHQSDTGQVPILITLTVLQIVTSKRHQFRERDITLNCDFNNCHFDCIRGNLLDLNRMLSNLINNAVDAYEDKSGAIDVEVKREQDQIKLIITDQAKGIPTDILQKICDDIAVTHDKVNGHGVGLGQVKEALNKMQGRFEISSEVGKGTCVTLCFQASARPLWLATEIALHPSDQVIVLDDDQSIHYAWDKRLQPYGIEVVHFTLGQDAIDYIEGYEDKFKLFLLTDFELLKQDINGIDVLKQTGITRSMLVTSHYNNATIQQVILGLNSKIIPKYLASEIPITLIEDHAKKVPQSLNSAEKEKVDLIIVDDDPIITGSYEHVFKDKCIHVYHKADDFLSQLAQYDKETLIFMDNTLKGDVSGIEVCKQLHRQGYSNMYLLSAQSFSDKELENNLIAIDKLDIERIKSIVRGKKPMSINSGLTLGPKNIKSSRCRSKFLHDLMIPFVHTHFLINELKALTHNKDITQATQLADLTQRIDDGFLFSCNFTRLYLDNWQEPTFHINRFSIESIQALMSQALDTYPFDTDISSWVDFVCASDFEVCVDKEHFIFCIWHLLECSIGKIQVNTKKAIKITTVLAKNEDDMNKLQFYDVYYDDFTIQYLTSFMDAIKSKIEYSQTPGQLLLSFSTIC